MKVIMTIKKVDKYWVIFSGNQAVMSCSSFEAALTIAEQTLYGT